MFDGKAKQESAENEVMQKLSQVHLLDLLIRQILEGEEEEAWLRTAQSYYDSRYRKVSIAPDGFEIKWSSFREETYMGNDGRPHTNSVEDVHGRVGYSYTKSGYLPLHEYKYDNGKKEISTQRVCYLWACIIRERMAAKMTDCQFGEVYEDATFSYIVPPLTFKDWF